MSQNLDQILSEAATKNLSLAAALESLTDRELEARNGRSIERRFRFSRPAADARSTASSSTTTKADPK